MATLDEDRYLIYMDTGGTFSDAIIIRRDGSFVTGKASTTPANLADCFFNCIEAATRELGKPLREVMSKSDLLGFGTTAGTNALLTRVGGPRLGLITTKGFEDTTIIMRAVARSAGLGLVEAMHVAGTDKPEPIVPRKLIKGVTERVDSLGKVVIPLYEHEVRQAVAELLQEGVEGIAVCFLWSFLNEVHERRAKEIIAEMAPDTPVSIAVEVSRLMREYPRYNSTIINLFIGRPVRELFQRVKVRLKENGYNKPLLVMQAAGGVSRSEVVQPITTLHSGPVGGLVGVEFFKNLYGFKNVMGSDVGGTSFDVSVVPEEGPQYVREPIVARFNLANPMLEIISIGAGGGTIAYVDKVTKTLRVGPRSAGADPGPVCYAKGGTEPTVTDADVVMNRIDPGYFLGGKIKLYRDMAYAAIKEKIADPMGMDVYKAAHAICEIIDSHMSDIVASTLRERGYDPESFVLFSFGGAGPTHCAGYSHGIGFKKVIVPPFAATFSAFGASTADVMHRYESSPVIVMPNIPYSVATQRFHLSSLDELPPSAVERFNKTYETIEERAFKDMQDEGFKRQEIKIRYIVEARYGGQLDEVVFQVPVSRIKTVEDFRAVLQGFEDEYAKLYSEIAMYPQGGMEIITMVIVASAPTFKPQLKVWDYVGPDSAAALKGRREVYFKDRFVEAPVCAMERLACGNIVMGPAIIEGVDTTFVVPRDRKITIDQFLNMVMEVA